MKHDTAPPPRPAGMGTALQQSLGSAEARLTELEEALRNSDGAAIQKRAAAFHQALEKMATALATASERGTVDAATRRRVSALSRRLAAQRESLARQAGTLDRALDALLPADAATAVYSDAGRLQTQRRGGSLLN